MVVVFVFYLFIFQLTTSPNDCDTKETEEQSYRIPNTKLSTGDNRQKESSADPIEPKRKMPRRHLSFQMSAVCAQCFKERAPSVEDPLSSPLLFSDVVSNSCLLTGLFFASSWNVLSVVLSKHRERNRGKGGGRGKGKILIWTTFTLSFFHYKLQFALIQWSVQQLGEIQAPKLQTDCIHGIHLTTIPHILLFSWPAINALFEEVLENGHRNVLHQLLPRCCSWLRHTELAEPPSTRIYIEKWGIHSPFSPPRGV